MKKRLVVPLVGLAISFALPTYAQQKDLADPQTTQKLLAGLKTDEEARNNNDPAAYAVQYTRDGVYIGEQGPVIGRQAIQKYFYRGVEVVEPQKLHLQGRQQCLSLDQYGRQRTVGNRRME
jgi:hypothetical protein